MSCGIVIRLWGSVLTVLGVIEAQYWFAPSLIFSEFSVAVPDFEVRFLLMATLVILHRLSVLVHAYAWFSQFQQ